MRSALQDITRYIHPISAQAPIKASISRHAVRTESRYDMHFGLEMGIVLSGAMTRYYSDYQRQVSRGQCWFCGMWEPHGGKVTLAPFEALVFVIWPPLLMQLRFEEAPDLNWMAPFIAKPAERPKCSSAIRCFLLERGAALKSRILRYHAIDKAVIRVELLNMLAVILEQYPELKPAGGLPSAALWCRLDRVLQYVFQSRVFISTSQAAKLYGLNRNDFSRLFKTWMGISFADFALRYRITAAAKELTEKQDSVKTTAYHWGFADDSHFNRLFTGYYGCSPAEFRQQH